MENTSILDQIIKNHKDEEVARLNAVEIVNNLFSELAIRERDILSRRFGLQGGVRETLETVGSAHKLTRERIRQIEVSSINKLCQLEKLASYVETLKRVIRQLLEEHGGFMEREYLLDVLASLSVDSGDDRKKEEAIHKKHLDFLISKLLHDEFEEENNLRNFSSAYKLKYQSLDHLEELADDLFSEIEKRKKILKTEEIIDLITKLTSYNKFREKFNIAYNIDISNILGSDLFKEKADVINNNKVLYSLLRAAKKVEQNKFGYWGLYDWREIKPKTINDKIYLVLKNYGNKPMHFTEIADCINKIGFDNKRANAATIHNELILDNKYVLVGRGLYGLKEWGYKRGTVVDVVKNILSSADEPMNREEIIEKVLKERMVKRATIILVLMNKDMFEKVNGRYKLKAKN